MHKLRSLARRGSGRVPPPNRRLSSSGQEKRVSTSLPQQQPTSHPQPPTAPELVDVHVNPSGHTNALAVLGRKIFGGHHHAAAAPTDSSAATTRRNRDDGDRHSFDLLRAYSKRRLRRGHEKSTLSGGTSLMDMQAFVNVNRTTSDVRYDETSDVFLESNRRRASEVARDGEASTGFVPLGGRDVKAAREVVIPRTSSLQFNHEAWKGDAGGVEDREASQDEVEFLPPPPPPLRPRPFKTPASPTHRHQKKGSQSSFTRSTSLNIGRKIINHKDLDMVVRHGDFAKRNRRMGVPPPKEEIYGDLGIQVERPSPPKCPMVADVFLVDDTVKRNRDAAMETLLGKKGGRRTEEVVRPVQSRKMQRMRVVDVHEDPADAGVEMATIRGRSSLPNLLELSGPLDHNSHFNSELSKVINMIKDFYTCLNFGDPAAFHRANFSEADVTSPEHPEVFPWELFPLPPAVPQRPVMKRSTTDASFMFRVSPSKFKKRESYRPLQPRPGKQWKSKDLEKLPCLEPAERIARVVRWVADVQEALDVDATEDAACTIRAPAPYVPYWLAL